MFAVLLLLCSIEYLRASDHTDARPNFIVMMVDDLGIGDIGCYGNSTVSVLIAMGRSWKRSASGCINQSHISWDGGEGGDVGSGKWHLGVNCNSRNDNCHHPVNHGFDYFYGLPFTLFNDCKPGEGTDILADLQALFRQASQVLGLALLTLLIAQLAGFFLVSWKLIVLLTITVLVSFCSWYVPFALVQTWNCIIMKNQDVIEQPMTLETLPQRLLNEAEYFIERNQQRPFFLFISFVHVHIPLFTSKDFMGKSQHGLYGDNVEEVDWMVGGKGMGGWEGGIRVPGIFRWPGTLSPGSVIDEPTSLMDVFPTLVNLAGGELPKDRIIDGHDLMPLMEDKVLRSEHEFMFHYCGIYLNAVRWHPQNSDAIYKAHFFTPNFSPEGAGGCYTIHICRCDEGFVTPHNPPLLFDLSKDPSESTPLVPDEEPLFFEIMQRIQGAVKEHNETLTQVPHQLSWSNILWKPWLQPCCGTFPFCSCIEKNTTT
ncbi:UNVERIFIED_CONTAM: hypothetical protein FKN15_056501 [Acipenser sinensis]